MLSRFHVAVKSNSINSMRYYNHYMQERTGKTMSEPEGNNVTMMER